MTQDPKDRMAQMRAEKGALSGKKRFSYVLSKTTFDGEILEVKGRMRLASLILLAFTIGIGFVVASPEIPIPVKALSGFGGLFTAWGFFDTTFGESYLRFDARNKTLSLRRGNPLSKVRYEGPAEGLLKVTTVSAGKTRSQEPLFSIVLRVTLDDAIVNYPLQVTSTSKEASRERVKEWQDKLLL